MKAVIGLVLVGLVVSPFALVGLGYWEPSISAIDAATAGVLSFALFLNAVAVWDKFAVAQWSPIDDLFDSHGKHLPIVAKIMLTYQGIMYHRSFVATYLKWRKEMFGAEPDEVKTVGRTVQYPHELYQAALSRYIPLFLLAGTGIARFILGEPIIPLTG